MAARTHEIDHDGRTLHVHEAGDADGLVIFSHHGTPGCGLHNPRVVEDAEQRGIRLLGIDRPGYGASSRQTGRSVADAAADVAAVADALGVDRFGTVGGSGGGPHTLACAALLGDRVIGCVSLAGIAPFDAAGLNWFAGMGEDNLIEFGASLQGEAALAPLLEEHAAGMTGADPEDMLATIATLVGPEDRAALNGELVAFLAEASKLALAPGIEGWMDDDFAFKRPWGFGLGSISRPVLIVHGRDDRFVPVTHGEWLGAAIPGADVRISNRDGHVSLIRHTGAVHEWLLDHAGD